MSLACAECGRLMRGSWLGKICPVCALGGDNEDEASLRGLTVAGHRVLCEIARGGMGIVYEALDAETGRSVAIKMLLPHIADRPGMRERFRLEARAVAGLDHPGILPVYAVGDAEDLPFMTMKLASRGTLAARRQEWHGKWRDIAILVATLSKAVHFAHSHGVLHRDIKPGNVLFDERDEPYLSDFGLAKVLGVDSDLTRTTQFLGTPHYAAPEVAARNASAASVASDVWSLGALLHELLLDQPPFEAEGLPSLLREIVEGKPRLAAEPGDIPRDLRIICLTCLAKEPRDRYASAAALAEDLKAWVDHRPIHARPPSFPERAWYRARRNPVLTLLVILLVGALGIIGMLKEHEAVQTRQALAASLLSEARLERLGGQFDRRDAALRAVERSLAIQRTPEARDELISILGWPQLELQTLSKPSSNHFTASPSARRLAVTTAKGIEIRHLDTGQVIAVSPMDPTAYHIVGPFTPDERYLIVRLEGHMELRDAATGTPILSIPGRSFSHTFDSAGKQLASAFNGGNMRMIALDHTPPSVRDMGPLTYRLIPKAFSPDGKTLAVKREYTALTGLDLIDSGSGVPVKGVSVPRAGNTQRAVYSPDGAYLYAAFTGGNIHRYALNQDLPTRIFSGHTDLITWIGLLENGRTMISQADDETTRFWDTATGELLATLPWSGDYNGATRTIGNRFYVLRGEDAFVTGTFVPSAACTTLALPDPDPDYAPAFGDWVAAMHPNGQWLAVSAQQNLHFINTRTWSLGKSFDIPGVFALSSAPDRSVYFAGRTLSLSEYRIGVDETITDQRLRMPSSTNGEPMTAKHVCWTGDAYGVAVSWKGRGIQFEGGLLPTPDPLLKTTNIEALTIANRGERLIAAAEGRIHSFRLNAAEPQPEREFNSGRVLSLAVDPSGHRLIAGHVDAFRCWDVETGDLLWEIPHALHSAQYRPVAWAAGCSLAAVALEDYSVSLVNPISGAVLAKLEHPRRHRVWSVAITPDGLHVAVLTSGHLVKIWHLNTLAKEVADRGFAIPFQMN